MSRPKFIADQEILSLELRPEDENRKLRWLRRLLPSGGVDTENDRSLLADESRWQSVVKGLAKSRLEFLNQQSGRSNRRLLCITATAGMGKSIALEQIRGTKGTQYEGHLVLYCHFDQIKQSPGDFLINHTTENPCFLVQLLQDDYRKARNEGADLPDPDLISDELYQWICGLVDSGELTLLVDGLDEVSEYSPEIARSIGRALRRFLNTHRKVHCVVAGRPHAINDTLWSALFANDPDHNDETSSWDFALVLSFDEDQIMRFLGNESWTKLLMLQSQFNFTPRTLEELRTLKPGTIKSIRTLSDVYWYGTKKTLSIDRKKFGGNRQTNLDYDQVLNLLAAIGITLTVWSEDLSSSAVESTPKTEKASSPITSNLSTPSQMKELVWRVMQRLSRIYEREWADQKITDRLKITENQILELAKLGTSYVEFVFSDAELPDAVKWENVSYRDFFAALWMVLGASDGERHWLLDRIDFARDMRDTSAGQIWNFVCGMPVKEVESRFSKAQSNWLKLIEPLFCRPTSEFHKNGRPTELMFDAWPQLLKMKGDLSDGEWDDHDLLVATNRAQTGCQERHRSREHAASDRSKQTAEGIIDGFLSEYLNLLDNDTEASFVIFEDLEDEWQFCASIGSEIQVGCNIERYSDLADEGDNPQRSLSVIYEFEICAIQVTNRIYALFDPFHRQRFKDYDEWSPFSRGPAIFLTFFDSFMFSIFCHGYLPCEWLWEHASRGESTLENGDNTIWPWGNDFDPNNKGKNKPGYVIDFDDEDDEIQLNYTWDWDTSKYNLDDPENEPYDWLSRHAHVVGGTIPNNFGVYDSIGNVNEWCLQSYRGSVTWSTDLREFVTPPPMRVLRGGSFYSIRSDSHCSHRMGEAPTSADFTFGCRVARYSPTSQTFQERYDF